MHLFLRSLRSSLFVLAIALAGCGGGGSDDPQTSEKPDLAPAKAAGNTFYAAGGGNYVAHVINQGAGASVPCDVLVTFSTFTGDVTVPFSIPALAPGELSPALVAPLPAGTTSSQYMIQIDVGNVVDESIETNNEDTEVVVF